MKNRHQTIINYAEYEARGMDDKMLLAYVTNSIIDELDDSTDQEIIDLCQDIDPDNELNLIE